MPRHARQIAHAQAARAIQIQINPAVIMIQVTHQIRMFQGQLQILIIYARQMRHALTFCGYLNRGREVVAAMMRMNTGCQEIAVPVAQRFLQMKHAAMLLLIVFIIKLVMPPVPVIQANFIAVLACGMTQMH